jgi:hypothetical protein
MLNKLKEKDTSKLTKEEVYDFLIKYLEEQISLSERTTRNEESFDTPNWALHQAYHVGMQKAFTRVKELIPLTKGKNND